MSERYRDREIEERDRERDRDRERKRDIQRDKDVYIASLLHEPSALDSHHPAMLGDSDTKGKGLVKQDVRWIERDREMESLRD